MKNIKEKENQVLEEFKSIIIIDRDGNSHPVPTVYANDDKIQMYIIKGEKDVDVRLPVIGINTTYIGHNHFVMDGVAHTLYRNDMNQIVEQLHHKLNYKILVSEVAIKDTVIYPSNGLGINMLTGRFTVEFRE